MWRTRYCLFWDAREAAAASLAHAVTPLTNDTACNCFIGWLRGCTCSLTPYRSSPAEPLPHACVSRALCPAGGAAHGVLLLNSNGQDITATGSSLSWRAIGGVLDFFFFLGPTPLAVLEQLTAVVGRPMMVPYWSLGLMNSKCALDTLS